MSNFEVFTDSLDKLLEKLSKFKYVLLAGDLNVDLMAPSNNRLKLYSILNLHNMKPSVTSPARKTTTSSTCIDNIFINFSPKDILNSNVNVFSDLGDHKHAQIISISVDKMEMMTKLLVRSYTPNQMQAFTLALSKANFSSLYSLGNVDDQLSHFYDIFLYLFNSNFPYKNISLGGRKKKDWITKGIQISSDKKRALYSLSLYSTDPTFHSYYRTYCKILQKVVRQAKRQYTLNSINKAPKHKKNKDHLECSQEFFEVKQE